MKKMIAITLVAATMFTGTIVSADIVNNTNSAVESILVKSQDDIKGTYKLVVNGVDVKLPTDIKSSFIAKDGTIMLPLRALAEALRYEVKWNGDIRAVEIIGGAQYTSITIGEDSYFFAKTAPVQLGNAPVIVDNSTYVPIDFFKDILKVNVDVKDDTIEMVNVYDEELPDMIYDFEKDFNGFKVDFSDLPVGDDVEEFYELSYKHKDIPVDKVISKGINIRGNNHSDDLFMYIYKNIGKDLNLESNKEYQIDVRFSIASNVAQNMGGIGGSPGGAVYVKAGVSAIEPKNITVDGNYRLNIDKGNQSTEGKDMKVLGNISKGSDSIDDSYQIKFFSTKATVKTDDKGNAYLIIGFDSGFEGITDLYVDDIMINFEEVK